MKRREKIWFQGGGERGVKGEFHVISMHLPVDLEQ